MYIFSPPRALRFLRIVGNCAKRRVLYLANGLYLISFKSVAFSCVKRLPNVTAEISPGIESYYMQWSERFNGNYAGARAVRKSALSARANTAIPARKWCLNSHRLSAGGEGGGEKREVVVEEEGVRIMLFDFPFCDCNRAALIRCFALGTSETIKGVCRPLHPSIPHHHPPPSSNPAYSKLA